ncbi:hypothetical protein DF186_15030, partial [Enterococcus hirae]
RLAPAREAQRQARLGVLEPLVAQAEVELVLEQVAQGLELLPEDDLRLPRRLQQRHLQEGGGDEVVDDRVAVVGGLQALLRVDGVEPFLAVVVV